MLLALSFVAGFLAALCVAGIVGLVKKARPTQRRQEVVSELPTPSESPNISELPIVPELPSRVRQSIRMVQANVSQNSHWGLGDWSQIWRGDDRWFDADELLEALRRNRDATREAERNLQSRLNSAPDTSPQAPTTPPVQPVAPTESKEPNRDLYDLIKDDDLL